ncbi:MAG: MFS transporter, partial [Gammaproteobacteria bacterium]
MSRELANRRIAAVAVLGFASGLPLALSDSTMQAWLTQAGVDVRAIGLFSLVTLPYVLKFLWAPLLDRFQPGWPGRRRDWILLTQLTLIALLAAAGLGNLADGALFLLGAAAFLIALLSATQDIGIDAYRTEVLGQRERGFGAAVATTGYRLAMLVSGAGALVMADRVGFARTYLVMAAILAVGLLATLLAPRLPQDVPPPRPFGEAVHGSLREFFARYGALLLLALVFLYKLGDAFAGRLTTTFLLRELGFSLTDVGAVYKGLGMVATIAGALYGGALMVRLGLYRALLVFAWLQAVTNLGFCLLALGHASWLAMVCV